MNFLKAVAALVVISINNITTSAQNVGIGTTNPQNTLHVAGGIRVDNLAGSSGIVTKNPAGDFAAVALTGNTGHVLRGDGTFGTLNGILPSTGVTTSSIYNNTALINAGYSLIGEIPAVTTYSTTSTTFPAGSQQLTYTRGIVTNVSAPAYTANAVEPPLAVWAGSLMYVWAGTTIYAYNPDTDLWEIKATNTLDGNFTGSRIVWTGTEIIFWSGVDRQGTRYNPGSNSFTSITTTNAPATRSVYTMIWTGSRVIVWGGSSGGLSVNTGAIYDPATNSWTATSITGAPAARMNHTAVWSTSTNSMIIWGGSTAAFSGELNTGALFDPAANTWTGATTTSGAPAARSVHTAVWTGTEMFIYGGEASSSAFNTGGRYNPVANTWTAVSTSGGPTTSRAPAAWSGSLIYLSGGFNSSTSASIAGLYSYNPTTNTWAFITNLLNGGRLSHHCFYKSNMVLSWGGTKNLGGPNSNEGSRYFLTSSPSTTTTFLTGPLYLYQKN